LTVIAVLMICCCAGIGVFGDRPKNGIRVEKLEVDLKTQLPDGSSWEESELWFSSHNLQPHVIDRRQDGRKSGLGVTIPNDSLLDTAEIRIELYFDETGRLYKRSIERFVYSF
jgi:hypothetical protein